MLDWKTAFLHEQNDVANKFVCFRSGAPFTKAVLGLPICFTINPKTRLVDYIRPSFHLLSWEQYVQGVRRTPDGELFQLLLPIYFSPGHFERALPKIEETLLDLCPVEEKYNQKIVLDVFPKIINTCIVLLADKGLATSKRVLQGFMWIHRLFLALVEHYQLEAGLNATLAGFITLEANRRKKCCPSLGNLLPLLLVSGKFTWKDIAIPYYEENMTRNVIWICKAYPELARTSGSDDEKRVEKTFEATKVSNRLMLLHVYFLETLSGGSQPKSLSERARLYDIFAVSTELQSKFNPKVSTDALQKAVAGILSVQDFPTVFRLIKLKLPAKEAFTAQLKTFVARSLAVEYHKKDTKFSNIHKSGTSKLLHSGESYSLKANELAELKFVDHWEFDPKSGVKYLDASVLLYEGHRFVDVVDFGNLHDTSGAIRHSGDKIKMKEGKGRHDIKLDLLKLPDYVDSLVFTLSAYAGVKLSEIKNPQVEFVNARNDQELCSYNQTMKNTGSNTAIIMCRVSRVSAGGVQGWHVMALGEICTGYAGNYANIQSAIHTLW